LWRLGIFLLRVLSEFERFLFRRVAIRNVTGDAIRKWKDWSEGKGAGENLAPIPSLGSRCGIGLFGLEFDRDLCIFAPSFEASTVLEGLNK
jgi:hypothetical protein